MSAARLQTKKLKPCWHCGARTPFVCARCKKPVCVLGYYYGGPVIPTIKAACATLRKRRSETGVYLLCCWPKCVKRRSKAVIEALEAHNRDMLQAARDLLDDAMGTGMAEDDQP